ncbi:hypothetical protein [Cellulomonas xiejunii]|uniref:hypothetical protein n=1 Tax=Cellulomonas xiejunii TaxID=2968083 RepID=UPI001D0DE4DA|nr:hypothetical protein [Cellulomonas xiejunii]MCC2313657.1 hypothetical protein [Cellulomonas xiejunii]
MSAVVAGGQQDQVERVLDVLFRPVAALRTALGPLWSSAPPDPAAEVVALLLACAVVTLLLALLLYSATWWAEAVSERVLRALPVTDADLDRYASLHVRVLVLTSVIRSWVGVSVGYGPPEPIAIPGVRAATCGRRAVVGAGRTVVATLLGMAGLVRFALEWLLRPLGLYLLAGAGWVVLRPDVTVVEAWLTGLWRAMTSATGLAVVAAAAAVLAVVLAHGPGTRLRGRNAYARDVAAKGQAVLERMGAAATDVVVALDRVVREIPSTRRIAVDEVLEDAGAGRWVLTDDGVRDRGPRAPRGARVPVARVGRPYRHGTPTVEIDLRRALSLLATPLADDVAARAAAWQARRGVRWIVWDVRRGCPEGRNLATRLSTGSVEHLYRSALCRGVDQDDVSAVNERLATADAQLRSILWEAAVYRARLAPLQSEAHGVHRPRGLQRLLRRIA